MPYIPAKARPPIARDMYQLLDQNGIWRSPGRLNYIITKLIMEHWHTNPCYATIAELTGVLENVKQEFYRRVAAPYEDRKCAENGDVYGPPNPGD